MKRTSLFLAVLLSTNVAKAEMLTSNHLYRYAQNKNYQALQKFSKWINITNKNKDTAICLALKDNNIEAYKLLLRYGANPRPSCLARINKYNNTNKNYHTSSSNSETFLGMGTTGWSITGGLLAAGGIAAAAGGGGGGSSSGSNSGDSSDDNNLTIPPIITTCVNGNIIDNKCICNGGWTGSACEEKKTCSYNTISCPIGYEQTGNTCQSGDVIYKECEIASCDGYEYDNRCPTNHISTDTCQSGNVIKHKCNACIEGYILQNGICYRELNCTSGYVQHHAECVKLGEDLKGTTNSYNNNNEIIIENSEHRNVYGSYEGDGNNSDFFSSHFDIISTSTIDITNSGEGTVYGMYGEYGNTFYADDVSYSNKLTNEVTITNYGNGNIYGQYNDAQYGFVSGNNVGGESDTTDNIFANSLTVNNSGDGDIFGMYAESYVRGNDLYVSNFSTTNTLTNFINITNEALGNVHGMHGYGTILDSDAVIGNYISIYNTDASTIQNNTLINDIVLNTHSEGFVYGIYANASAEGNFLIGTNNPIIKNNTLTNSISITNNGSAELYGMFGKWVVGNDLYANESTSSDNDLTNTITIINSGDDDVHGIYGNNVRGNELETGTFSSTLTNSISLTNKGKGNVYGIYVNIESTYNDAIGNNLYAENEDLVTNNALNNTIKINTIGDGCVYGIYSNIEDDDDTILGNYLRLEGVSSADNNVFQNNILIDNFGGGAVYGMHGSYVSGNLSEVFDVASTDDNLFINRISLANNGNGNVYGMYGERYLEGNNLDATENDTLKNEIITINEGDGSIYGMFSSNEIVGNYFYYDGKSNDLFNTISLTNKGGGNVYGMYGDQSAEGNYITGGNDSTISDNSLINSVNIVNEGSANLYGIFGRWVDGNDLMTNNTLRSNNSFNTISLTNSGHGNVYGMYGNDIRGNDLDTGNAFFNTLTNTITITNKGYGDVYGIFMVDGDETEAEAIGNSLYGSKDDSLTDNTLTSTIAIDNIGNGLIYGIYSLNNNTYGNLLQANEATSIENNKLTNTITINNVGNGNVCGMRGDNIYGNLSGMSGYSIENNTLNNRITLINIGNGNAFGMYGKNIYSSYDAEAKNNFSNYITINSFGGNAVGMYGTNNVINESSDMIWINNIGNNYTKKYFDEKSNSFITERLASNEDKSIAVGIYATDGNVQNSGVIDIFREIYTANDETETILDDIEYVATNSIGGTAVGIYGKTGTVITNNDFITITNAKVGYGIYHEGNGGSVTNTGTIEVSATNAYGIFVENGINTTVINIGTISLNGRECTGDCSGSVSNEKHIVLNGGTLLNDGIISANSLNLNNMGGKVVATSTSSFVAENISGNIAINNSVIENGFNTTYSVKNMIQAEDASGLNLYSQSALFDASLAENNSDVNLKMKKFNDVVNNKSLADFLQNNYALENNETFYNTLKKRETTASLNEALNELTGQKLFSRFADEDLMMMRELTFDMNNKLFMNNDNHLETSGNISTFNFNGNSGSNSRYALINHNYGKYKLGLNYGFADVSSYDNDNDNRRKEKMFHIGMPISYNKQGIKFITTPHVGYASGIYDRKGLNSENYDGHIEKTMFGLMNEARYPIAFDKWTIAPSAEFNVVNYATKGHEKGGTNPLKLDLQHNYSVELGLGLYANTEYKLGKQSKLSFTGGVAMYHEFADPYKLSIGMEGMSGKFDIRDENRGDNRAVIRTGLKFDNGNMSLGANVMSYIDREYRTNATLDFKYGF